MPISTQIDSSAEPLTAEQAQRLKTIVGASQTYSTNAAAADGYDEAIDAKVGIADIQSRELAALAVGFDKLKDSMLAIEGGSKGIKLSKEKDREYLVRQVLVCLGYQLIQSRFSQGSAFIRNQPGW